MQPVQIPESSSAAVECSVLELEDSAQASRLDRSSDSLPGCDDCDENWLSRPDNAVITNTSVYQTLTN